MTISCRISTTNIVKFDQTTFSIKHNTVAIAFFLSTETHAKRLLTIWKRSVCTTLKRSFTVLAN